MTAAAVHMRLGEGGRVRDYKFKVKSDTQTFFKNYQEHLWSKCLHKNASHGVSLSCLCCQMH